VSFALLGVAVVLSAHVLTASAASLALLLVLPALEARLPQREAGPRALVLFVSSLLPAAAGLVVALGLALPAWLGHEPRDTGERAGLFVLWLAAAGAGLVALRISTALSDERRTRRLVGRWTAEARALPGLPFSATRLALDYPVAALSGIFRPRLLLSESLLAVLEPEELEAVIEHERAHVEARENLKRFLLRASPDPLALLPAGARLRAAFEAAAEEAADRAACARVSPLVLARTLLKVAALVPQGHGLELPLAALHREGLLEARVRALVARADATALRADPARANAAAGGGRGGPVVRSRAWGFGLAALAVSVLAAGAFALPFVHRVLERLVHL
jgi:Zn-dependent protease with chaperone function